MMFVCILVSAILVRYLRRAYAWSLDRQRFLSEPSAFQGRPTFTGTRADFVGAPSTNAPSRSKRRFSPPTTLTSPWLSTTWATSYWGWPTA